MCQNCGVFFLAFVYLSWRARRGPLPLRASTAVSPLSIPGAQAGTLPGLSICYQRDATSDFAAGLRDTNTRNSARHGMEEDPGPIREKGDRHSINVRGGEEGRLTRKEALTLLTTGGCRSHFLCLSTVCGHRIAHRKWKETKQVPDTAGPGNMLGCCLISFHFL